MLNYNLMTTMNMNGNNNDTNYRYKMPIFNITIGGKGNGIFTIFNNITEISKALNHPTEVIMKYLAAVSGSNYIQARETITGPHTLDELGEFIIEYNKYLVFCQKCCIPETIPNLAGNKKNPKLEFCCSACKTTTEAKSTNKRIEKGIDIIIKYLKAGGEWKMHKGTGIKQSTNIETEKEIETDDEASIQNTNADQTIEEINPFDFL